MDESFDFGDIFGYNRLLRKPLFFALQGKNVKGENMETLRLGSVVRLRGDIESYVPSGFEPGERVIITSFRKPGDGEPDHIIQVSNLNHGGWVRPSDVEEVLDYHGSLDNLDYPRYDGSDE